MSACLDDGEQPRIASRKVAGSFAAAVRHRAPRSPVMVEVIVILSVVLLLALVALASIELLAVGGLILAMVGLLFGTPTGFVYHVHLRRALSMRGELPRRWWMNPVRYHAQLSRSEFDTLRTWFNLGAAGFVLSIVGCALALCGLAKAVVFG